MARERGTSGIVVLQVSVNELGLVDDIQVSQSLSAECDQEARRALYASTQQGYSPFIYEGSPVRFKLDVPVGYWLE